METPLHNDLHDFMLERQQQISSEYERISKRAAEDPGTAGDEGEENWANLLRDWLPSNYTVVTKGRIMTPDGMTSRQMDVVVLKGTYPKGMVDRGTKTYLAAGVAAAFECKITLRANHIDKAVRTSAELKGLYPSREGSPYKELHSPIIYGLLAHSHIWKRENSTPERTISDRLQASDEVHVEHPRLGLDLICVSDLCTWKSFKEAYRDPRFINPELSEDALLMAKRSMPYPAAHTRYFYAPHRRIPHEYGTPIGAFISYLIERMAWENPDMRDIAEYFTQSNISGMTGAFGPIGHLRRLWPSSIYSKQIRPRVESSMFDRSKWSEWSIIF